jgi:DNA-directed RNA polymerase specialized sigma24 family protein
MTGIDAADLPLVASADVTRLQAALAAVGMSESEALGELFDACGADLYGLALCRTGHVQDAEDVLRLVLDERI